MNYPKNLEKGSYIGVTATSSGFTSEVDLIRLANGVENFNKRGYSVIITDNVKKNNRGRSSDGATRANELMRLFNDDRVRVIMAASGGDFLVEMLSYIDYKLLLSRPKWVQGFSDTTGLLFTITTNLDIASIYSYNFGSFGMEPWHSSLSDNLKLLEGQDILQQSYDSYQDGYRERITGLEGIMPDKEVSWVNINPMGILHDSEINIHGRAVGGCLDVLLTLIGTRFDKTMEFINKYKDDKIIWFLESYELGSASLVRGLWQLKEAGWFDHAAGFIFGRPAIYNIDYDITYEEAIISVLGGLERPIILEADIGHKPPQFAMINGAIAHIKSCGGKGSILFERR
jgi:muramoyltetrapeptide carboxypeptidase LdcA involved in peptidoglycan recycling